MKEKLEQKADMAEALERGSLGILPRAGKRASREAGSDMKEIQAINEQLKQLEAKRQSILLSLG